ncbi:MAG TPA: BPSS1780 family membrane protein [Oleiagrimonas sp.]|nr:BPSS1780 family membrane protein [Oleiagrimonas sp.]
MNRPQPPRKIGATQGWHWFVSALDLVRRQPATFLCMGLFVACVDSLLPYIGPLAVLIMGPAFLAGMCVAANTIARQQPPAFAQVFALLAQPGRRGEALKLCIPLVLGKFAAAMILGVALTNQLARKGIDVATLQGQRDKLMTLLISEAMVPWFVVALVVVVFTWTFTALAIPRVAFSREPAFTAMGESFRLVWRHIPAWFVAGLALCVCVVAVGMVLLLTRFMLLVQVGFFTTLYTVLGPMLYIAWRDLGGHPPSGDPDQPPPPSGVLEA